MWPLLRHYVVLSTIAALSIATVSCGKPNPKSGQVGPIQNSAWTGRPGNLGEWGYVTDCLFGTLATTDPEKRLLVIWKWRDDSISEAGVLPLPKSTNILPVSGGLCGLSLYPGNDFSDWPYALLDVANNRAIKQWSAPKGWTISHAGASLNGKFISLVATDGVDADGYKFEHDRARVAIIDVDKPELRWVSNLDGHGAGTIREIAITDDGRHVAVAGWDNGTAMVDAKEGRVLWAKRPEGEVSTGYAAFAPDGKLIYTAGSEGCVYAIDVATGNILGKRWATSTGQSIYAHRISALAVSPDGKWLAAGTGPEGEVYIWNSEKQDKALVLNHGHGTILIVAFSPDSTKLASVGSGILKVWQLKGANQ
jgi:WD40 repeat protein